MSLQDLTTVLNHLPRLNLEELQKVKLKLSASLSLTNGGNNSIALEPLPAYKNYLLSAISSELRRRGLIGHNARIAEHIITDKFKQDSAKVILLLQEHIGPLKAVEYAALGQLAIKALATYLEMGNITIAPRVLINNIDKVPQAIDASYPGYLEAGLIPFCWR